MHADQPTIPEHGLSEAPEPNWRLLAYFNVYRLVVAALLITSTIAGHMLSMFGMRLPALSAAVSIVFAAVCALHFLTIAAERPRFFVQTNYQMALDIVLLVALMHASTGINSALAILLVVTIAAAGVLLPIRLTLFYAALATCLVLAQQTYVYAVGEAPITGFSKVGVLGIALFVTALVIRVIARRIATAEDIARQRQSEVLTLDQINRAVVDRLELGVMFVDKDYSASLLNDRAAVLLSASDAPRTQPLERLSPRLNVAIRNAADAGTPAALPLEIKLDGHTLAAWVHRVGNAGQLVFLEDHSEQKRRAEQAKLAALGRMAAAIAHEIRNPLSAISHAQQLLQESDPNEADAPLLEIIDDQSQRIERVIKSILGLSRRSEPASALWLRPWLDVFVEAFTRARGLAPESVRLKGPNLEVMTNPDHLDQALTNLLDNALRHSEACDDEARVTLVLAQLRDGPALDVVNSGAPIAAEHRERLFEPFFTAVPGGTGLGLYIARQLCEANNATLELVSENGEPRFRIIFRHVEVDHEAA